MKKQLFVILILCAALMFTLSGTALAAGAAEYTSPDIGISFSMPPDFKILSRDSYKTDPAAEELPYPQENLDEWFAGDYYFIGASDAAYCIFSLRAYPDGHDRFAAIIEDGELDALTNALADSFVEDGSEVLSAETYPHAENTVLRFGYLDTDEDGSTDYNVTFFTVCGENTVRIDFWFPFSAGSAEQDALADGVIDSMKFSAAVPQPQSPAGTAKTIVSCVAPCRGHRRSWRPQPENAQRQGSRRESDGIRRAHPCPTRAGGSSRRAGYKILCLLRRKDPRGKPVLPQVRRAAPAAQ